MGINIDRNMLAKLLSLKDDEFKEVVKKSVSAKGADKDMLDKAFSDVSALKKALSGLSENDLKKAISIIGSDKVEDIIKNLNQNLK